MHPYNLIGLKYRLGADPQRHKAADCLTLAKAVLKYQGVPTPAGRREWYRRLRRGDTAVFQEELSRWGVTVEQPKLVTVALCQTDSGFGMASYFEDGWIHFAGSAVQWSPIGALQVVALYCPSKLISATILG
jgi:hypothetical protein